MDSPRVPPPLRVLGQCGDCRSQARFKRPIDPLENCRDPAKVVFTDVKHNGIAARILRGVVEGLQREWQFRSVEGGMYYLTTVAVALR